MYSDLLRLAQEESHFLYDRFETSERCYFGMLRFSKKGSAYSRGYRLSRREELLEKHYNCEWGNVFQSQNILTGSRRLKQNVGYLTSQFVDCDCHSRGDHQGIPPSMLTGPILDHLSSLSIPLPSSIVFSGCGLHVKWMLEKLLPRERMPEWDLVQKRLVEALKIFGSDPKARDANRVLRVQGSINPRSGLRVQEYWSCRTNGVFQTVLFEDMKRALKLDKPPKINFFKEGNWMDFLRSKTVPRAMKTAFLEQRILSFALRGHHIVVDLMKLAELRGWKEHGLPDGYRDLFFFWVAVHIELSYLTSSLPRVYHETLGVVRDLLPAHWGEQRIQNALSSVYSRLAEIRDGKLWKEENGHLYPNLYTPSNEYLIETFDISDAELRELDYIQSPSTLSSQRQRKRLEQGGQTQAQISVERKEKIQKAKLMKKLGHNLGEIAAFFGVNRRTVRAWINTEHS